MANSVHSKVPLNEQSQANGTEHFVKPDFTVYIETKLLLSVSQKSSGFPTDLNKIRLNAILVQRGFVSSKELAL